MQQKKIIFIKYFLGGLMSTDNKPQQHKEMYQNYLSGHGGRLEEQSIAIIHLR